MASCLEAQNVNRVISCDLHSDKRVDFLVITVGFDNLYNEVYFVDYIKYHIIPEFGDNIVIVAPIKTLLKYLRVSGKLNVSAATIFKNRERAN